MILESNYKFRERIIVSFLKRGTLNCISWVLRLCCHDNISNVAHFYNYTISTVIACIEMILDNNPE